MLRPNQLVAILERGRQASVTVLTGYTKGEFKTLQALEPIACFSPDEYQAMILDRSDDLTAKFLRHYLESDLEGSIPASI